jgi:hypothetical protein
MDRHWSDVRCIFLELHVTNPMPLWTRRENVPAMAKPINIVKKAVLHQVNH